MDQQYLEIRTSAIRSVKWSFFLEWSTKLLNSAVTLTLVRLLSPSDFGVASAATLIINLVLILQNFGLGKTLIQRDSELEKSSHVVFWTNLLLSFLIYSGIYFSSPFLSQFFHEPRIIKVLPIMSLIIILQGFFIVNHSILQRNFEFKRIFYINLIDSFITGVIAILLAFKGYGVWALVYSSLIGNLALVFIYSVARPWHPKFTYNFKVARKMWQFGGWIILEDYLLWIVNYGEFAFVGHFLGIGTLGLYQVGFTMSHFLFENIINPLVPISYSAFSKLKRKSEQLKRSILKITQMVTVFSLPIGAAIALLAKPSVDIIFGQKWENIEIVIAVLALRYAISSIFIFAPEAFRAIGRPDINPKLGLLSMVYFLPVYFLAAPRGLNFFLWATLAATILDLIVFTFFIKKILKISFLEIGGTIKYSIISTLVMVIVICFLITVSKTFEGFVGLLEIIGITAISVFIYFRILKSIGPEISKQVFKMAKLIVS